MLAAKLARRADGRRIALVADLVIADVGTRVVAIAGRLEEGVGGRSVVIVHALGQQGGRGVDQR